MYVKNKSTPYVNSSNDGPETLWINVFRCGCGEPNMKRYSQTKDYIQGLSTKHIQPNALIDRFRCGMALLILRCKLQIRDFFEIENVGIITHPFFDINI